MPWVAFGTANGGFPSEKLDGLQPHSRQENEIAEYDCMDGFKVGFKTAQHCSLRYFPSIKANSTLIPNLCDLCAPHCLLPFNLPLAELRALCLI